jgi:hypothetical protein
MSIRFYLDTEFHEFHRQPKLAGIKIGKPIPTIDLISIGIYAETGETYYALCSDVDLRKVWKEQWLRENVLQAIYNEQSASYKHEFDFSYHNIKWLFRLQGKPKAQIAAEITSFVHNLAIDWTATHNKIKGAIDDAINDHVVADSKIVFKPVEFWGYFSDYDWVVFCQLFGRMIDLPKGFPFYCLDLKQLMDNYFFTKEWKQKNYPDPKNEHNALVDAIWNFNLHQKILEYVTVNYK